MHLLFWSIAAMNALKTYLCTCLTMKYVLFTWFHHFILHLSILLLLQQILHKLKTNVFNIQIFSDKHVLHIRPACIILREKNWKWWSTGTSTITNKHEYNIKGWNDSWWPSKILLKLYYNLFFKMKNTIGYLVYDIK